MVVGNLSLTFTALADPTRRAIIDRLMIGPASVNDLAEPFEVSQQAISKHLACLEKANFIKKRKDGRQNICELNAEPFRQVDSWVNKHRAFWESAIDRLDSFLHEMKNERNAIASKRNAKTKK